MECLVVHRYVHQFKVTHKLFWNIESSVLFVGFPVTSLPKYVQEGTSVFDVDEKCKDLVLADDVIPEGMTVDVMKTDYEAWKASVQELIGEVSVVGGVLIAAAGLGVMGIKDCKTINLLPALLMPMVFFALKDLLALI